MDKKKKTIAGAIRLGQLVRDKVTGFEGVATGYTDFFHGCRRFSVQSCKLKDDGTPATAISFDEPQLEILEDRFLDVKSYPESAFGLEMGDEVADVVTGFKGIVYGLAYFAFSPRRVAIQSQKIQKDGHEILDPVWFDDDSLKLIAKGKVLPQGKTSKKNEELVPGGPDKLPSSKRQTSQARQRLAR